MSGPRYHPYASVTLRQPVINPQNHLSDSFRKTILGTVLVNGKGTKGQLGLGSAIEAAYHLHIIETLNSVGIVDISTGYNHSAAIDIEGRECNTSGALGRNGDGWKPALVDMLNSMRVAAVSYGWAFTLALSDSGCLYAWGSFCDKEGKATCITNTPHNPLNPTCNLGPDE
ncbi:regulator of chromosome condensation 1/beta-lactamase-inhibitor protein II [Jimgerdemannia flammicorona]|uniref:Regulator of chromosome condensation 1/beta-lactamase-inhibitor protein II n=1 Tax=Jimgerdemannia flammicorona TaxID=994334 RepID=A0A433QYG4_9FUNG|nr:regulator of chromosome condensation 1/beta-lactamase-inhibitor protein II [Jimgerdemannia flammicorona]